MCRVCHGSGTKVPLLQVVLVGAVALAGRQAGGGAQAVVCFEQLLVVPDVVPGVVEQPAVHRLVPLQPADEAARLVGAGMEIAYTVPA